MCSVVVSKKFKKGARGVAIEDRKSNRLCCLVASLRNLLLPGAREETSFNIINCVKFQYYYY